MKTENSYTEETVLNFCMAYEKMIRFAAYTYVKDECLADEITMRVMEKAGEIYCGSADAEAEAAGLVREESIKVMEEVIMTKLQNGTSRRYLS